MKRLLLSTTLAATLALPAAAFDIDAMSDEERAAFRDEIRAYLLDNPEVIMEAVAVLEERNQAAAAASDTDLIADNAEAIFNDSWSQVSGNPEGDITIVEFIDYRCGYCRRAHDEVVELVATDGNIRMITKEFPILGANSTASAQLAIAAKTLGGDEAYTAANEALIRLTADMNEPVIRRLADQLGLEGDALLAAMQDEEVGQILGANAQLARALGINGTPSFVIGNEMLRGYVPLKGMQEIVARVREES